MGFLPILLVSLWGELQASDLPACSDEVVMLQRHSKSKHAITGQDLDGQKQIAKQLVAIHKFLQKQPDGDADGDADSNADGDVDADADADADGDAGVGVDVPAGEEGLQSLRQMLESQIEGHLVKLHDVAASKWQLAVDSYTECGIHKARRFDDDNGDVVLAARAMHQARLKHHACRQSAKAWNTFHSLSHTYSPAADLGVHNVDAATITFGQAIANAQLLAQTYDGIAPVGMHECLVDQTSFEMSYCIWQAKASEACNAHTICSAGVGLTDMHNQLLVDSAERQALWRTVAGLKCRIDQMMMVNEADGASNTDPCEDLVVNTDHLVLALPPPSVEGCTDEQLPPLTSPSTDDTAQCAAWMGTEYSWDASDAVLPGACATTCVGVHPPQPPSDCEDASSQCEFFQQHPSACGSFPADGQSFESCTDCCYCKFSPACGHCPPGYIVSQGGTACQECVAGQIPNDDSTSCVDPQPCVASVDCSGHGTTDDLDKSDGCSCSCGDGYSGFDCSTPPPCDAIVHCSGHGATVDLDSTDGCDCACDEGFEGANCLALPKQP